MRNKLSFFGVLTLILFTCWVGGIGKMANASFCWIYLPLGIDIGLDIIRELDKHYMWQIRVWQYLKAKQIAKYVKKEADKLK